jgi:hypothetical protein
MDDKLVIEVSFKDGEKERFLQFVEDEAMDQGKYIRKLIMGALEKREQWERRTEENRLMAAGPVRKRGKPA